MWSRICQMMLTMNTKTGCHLVQKKFLNRNHMKIFRCERYLDLPENMAVCWILNEKNWPKVIRVEANYLKKVKLFDIKFDISDLFFWISGSKCFYSFTRSRKSKYKNFVSSGSQENIFRCCESNVCLEKWTKMSTLSRDNTVFSF